MKIATINKFSQPSVQQPKRTKNIPVLNPQSAKPEETLSLFKTKGLNITFGAVVVNGKVTAGKTVIELLTNIDITKKALEILKKGLAITESQEIKAAKDIISRYNYWLSNDDRIFNESKKAANAAREKKRDSHSGWHKFWHPSCGDAEYEKVMSEMYYNKKNYYDVGYNKYNEAKIRVDGYQELLRISEANRQKEIKTKEELLKSYEKQLVQATINDDILGAMNNKGGLNETIAGYDDLKKELQRTFVAPLIESTKAGNADSLVPPAVMLYGATGCGKTAMLEAIKRQSKDYAQIVQLGAGDIHDFKGELDTILKGARSHYLETLDKKGRGERTIILLNEAEVYLAANPEEANLSGMFYSKGDIQNLETYNKLHPCKKNIDALKSMLDYISKLPEDENAEGCAATLFITTNYPHLIHRDLLSRDGEFGKMLSYAVRPAANNDLEAVLKHYFSKASEVVELIKYAATVENSDEIINNIPKLSDKAKSILKEKIKNKTVNNLHIDPNLGQMKNLTMFIKGNNPSLVRGAYSNARWQNIIYRALMSYLENPAIPFETHFIERKNAWGKDILPAAYRRFENICNMVENPEKFKQNQFAEVGQELINMVNSYQDGLISDSDKAILKLKIKDVKDRYNEFNNSENLSPTEEKIKQQYKEFLDSIVDIELFD